MQYAVEYLVRGNDDPSFALIEAGCADGASYEFNKRKSGVYVRRIMTRDEVVTRLRSGVSREDNEALQRALKMFR